jgi:cysteine desulfurase
MIYLDYAATTPCLPEVIDAMLPFMRASFGNAASIDHLFGNTAKAAVDQAREEVAKLVGARPEDVFFTSGATEANNLVLNNSLALITGTMEHPSVRDAALSRSGASRVQWVTPGPDGIYLSESLHRELGLVAGRALVSLMNVNNEIGSQQPSAAFAEVTRSAGHFFHADATQGAAYGYLSLSSLDAMSISAHKMHGPKGVGALACTPELRRKLKPLSHGGGHERGLRSGTLNVPGIVGFGKAASMALHDRDLRVRQIAKVRAAFLETLRSDYQGTTVINSESCAAPHICSITLDRISARALLNACRTEVCFSLGSACATNKSEPSYVLTAINLNEEQANQTIRCSFSFEVGVSQAEEAARILSQRANALREFSVA